MEMNQIRYFLALCEELSFTRAAAICEVSQPSLTNGIRLLERELGGRLFVRKPRIELTELGRVLRPHFREIARHAHNVREAAVRTLGAADTADASLPAGRRSHATRSAD